MYGFLIAAFTFAALEWVGEHKRIRGLIYFTKPLVILCLLVWVWWQVRLSGSSMPGLGSPLGWFMIALVCCLVGDIFLMLPERFFVIGLFAFLLGHMAYILGFEFGIPRPGNAIPTTIMVGMIAFVSLSVYRKLAQGLKASGKSRMILPVFVYAVVISYMLYAALNTLQINDWHYTAALPVSFGALLFYISDILNAWHRFVRELPAGRLKIMTTYHLAQFALIAGVVVHYFYRVKT